MHARNLNAFKIRTPEGVTFSLRLAGPVARCLAWALDLLAIFTLGILLSIGLALLGVLSPDLAQAAMVIVWFVLQVGYSVGFEWAWHGQTPGKRLLRLRVLDAEGFRLTFSQVLMRNLLRFVDFLPGLYLVGALATLVTKRSQRLGDLAANTIVIRLDPVAPHNWEGLEPGKYNSLLAAPHIVARLRQHTEVEAAYLALRSLLRRHQLDPLARVEVFQAASLYYRQLVRFPDDLIEGLSDEQLVRNIVESVFRSTSRNEPGLPSISNRAAILR